MVPVNITTQRCHELADVLGCKVESLPFTNLGAADGYYKA
jgi:hypothetical protein